MKVLLGSLLALAMFSAPAAQAWTEVANEMIFADQPTFQQVFLRKSKAEYQEVMVQIMNPNGARIQRAEIITEQGWSKPVWRLEGDYRFGMQRTDVFQKAKVNIFRTYLTTLRQGEPVRLRVMMR